MLSGYAGGSETRMVTVTSGSSGSLRGVSLSASALPQAREKERRKLTTRRPHNESDRLPRPGELWVRPRDPRLGRSGCGSGDIRDRRSLRGHRARRRLVRRMGCLPKVDEVSSSPIRDIKGCDVPRREFLNAAKSSYCWSILLMVRIAPKMHDGSLSLISERFRSRNEHPDHPRIQHLVAPHLTALHITNMTSFIVASQIDRPIHPDWSETADSRCIFCRIVAKQSKAYVVYEDEEVIAFLGESRTHF